MKSIVDLSLDLYDKAPTFWPDPKTAIIPHLKIENLGYNITQLVMSTHLGTHLDAPFHFFEDGKTVDQIELSKGFGPAWILDFTNKGAKEEITRKELEKYGDKITKGSRIIIHTGWYKVFPENRYFSEPPGIHVDACKYLSEKKIACLAMDMPTVHPENYIDVHHILLKAEILIVEGLNNLGQLKESHIFFVALPLRIKGRDGSPCRAIAVEGFSENDLKMFNND
jgi:arylformamidase